MNATANSKSPSSNQSKSSVTIDLEDPTFQIKQTNQKLNSNQKITSNSTKSNNNGKILNSSPFSKSLNTTQQSPNSNKKEKSSSSNGNLQNGNHSKTTSLQQKSSPKRDESNEQLENNVDQNSTSITTTTTTNSKQSVDNNDEQPIFVNGKTLLLQQQQQSQQDSPTKNKQDPSKSNTNAAISLEDQTNKHEQKQTNITPTKSKTQMKRKANSDDEFTITSVSNNNLNNTSKVSTFGNWKKQKTQNQSNFQFQNNSNNNHHHNTTTNINNNANQQHPFFNKSVKMSKPSQLQPLAEKVRPKDLEGFIGQHEILQQGGVLRSFLEGKSEFLPSLIFWGPPGTGKTSLARLLASKLGASFVQLSAVDSGLAKVREILERASDKKKMGQRTVLFVDEIHRYNKLQQDTFLPAVEDGTITLVGGTTENPSFEINNALLSRCKVFVLRKLEVEEMKTVLLNAISKLETESTKFEIDEKVIDQICVAADGDARQALNMLEMAVNVSEQDFQKQQPSNNENPEDNEKDNNETKPKNALKITLSEFQRSHFMFDKRGDMHYDIISALHKSMRGSDVDAALYWLTRQLEGGENPLYIARRLIRFASEDVGMADPQALVQATTSYQACHFIGMPECNLALAQCVTYLCLAPKSNSLYEACNLLKQTIREQPTAPVPMHIRNAPTFLMKNLGYGDKYMYNPDMPQEAQNQRYLPDYLHNQTFFKFRMHKPGVSAHEYNKQTNMNGNQTNMNDNTSTTTTTTTQTHNHLPLNNPTSNIQHFNQTHLNGNSNTNSNGNQGQYTLSTRVHSNVSNVSIADNSRPENYTKGGCG